jgi:vancomycin resistance protein YoaR
MVNKPVFKSKPSIHIEQVLIAIGLGFIAFCLLLFCSVFVYQLSHLGRVYTGVSVAGIEVGKLTQSEAAAKLSQELTYSQTGQILFIDGERSWLVSPLEIGLILDIDQTVKNAYQLGREENFTNNLRAQFDIRHAGKEISPVFVLNEQNLKERLNTIASEINHPIIEPKIVANEGNVAILEGQAGRSLDIDTAMKLSMEKLTALQNAAISLPIVIDEPAYLDINAQAQLAATVLKASLTLRLTEDQPDYGKNWVFSQNDLANMLTLIKIEDETQPFYQVALDNKPLETLLKDIKPELSLEAENARFIFNDDTRKLDLIQPAVIGRELDINGSIDVVKTEIIKGNHDVPLVFNFTPPSITDSTTAEELGITELVHQEVSYFYGSSAARVQNISVAASKFHGVMIPPGETFSMANSLGEISLENGYAEGLIIFGDSTIEGVGGGVCQVSTTLFRSAFFSGFPILERHAHAYRVSYYEKTYLNHRDDNLAGLDATVFLPVIDLKFTNDTPYWLLMETYVIPSNSSLTWKFYSTSDGRTVDWQTTGPYNIVEAPDTLYRENSNLEKGEIKQVDWESDGADVRVNRTVYTGNEILFEDSFYTHYQPWQAVYEYGPGTENMPPQDENKGEDD